MTPITFDAVRGTFGGSRKGSGSSSANAYLLFYRRVDPARNARLPTDDEVRAINQCARAVWWCVLLVGAWRVHAVFVCVCMLCACACCACACCCVSRVWRATCVAIVPSVMMMDVVHRAGAVAHPRARGD